MIQLIDELDVSIKEKAPLAQDVQGFCRDHTSKEVRSGSALAPSSAPTSRHSLSPNRSVLTFVRETPLIVLCVAKWGSTASLLGALALALVTTEFPK